MFLSCSPIVYNSTQAPPPPQQQNLNAAPNYIVFYDDLSPYGIWVDYPNYGYVWMPKVSRGFAPYCSGGHWVYTEYGWTWFSTYSWGWAPFHYGRWFFDDSYGWLWVPGNEWAPAWVVWGYYDNYYGWAPVGPGVHKYEGYRPPHNHWHFVHSNQITENNINNYVVNNTTIINNNVTIINNYNTYKTANYNSGPKKEEVEKVINKRIMPVDMKETDRPLLKKEVRNINKEIDNKRIDKKVANPVPVYRPSINEDIDVKKQEKIVTPKKIQKLENIKTLEKESNKAIDKKVQEKETKKINPNNRKIDIKEKPGKR